MSASRRIFVSILKHMDLLVFVGVFIMKPLIFLKYMDCMWMKSL
jgi:hypothetical protein